MAIKVNAGNAYRDSFFKLMANIDLEGKVKPWTPIGTEGNLFGGNFNGDSHIISNVYVDTTQYAGLFGCQRYGMISNLGVENVEIYGSRYAGGLIGLSYGTVESCYATGAVTAKAIKKKAYAGGLIGNNYDGSVLTCYATGAVSATSMESGSEAYAGGLIGLNCSTVESCYATGAVSATAMEAGSEAYVGGLIGESYACDVINCYATGNVTATTGNKAYASGLIGRAEAGNVLNCYATGRVTGKASDPTKVYTGGLTGYVDYGNVENCYYDQETTGQSDKGKGEPLETKYMIVPAFVDTLNGNPSLGAWKVLTDSYPRLHWENIGFSVNVTNGTATPKTAGEGQSVTLTAEEPQVGWAFTQWIGNIELLDADGINKASIKFIMPAKNVSFEAIYEKIPYSVTLTNGTANPATAYLDSIVTLTADDKPGWVFTQWTGNIELLDADSINKASIKFVMPAQTVSFEATYEKIPYSVTVTNGTANPATAYLDSIVTLIAEERAEDWRFIGWACDDASLLVADSIMLKSTTFIMPAKNVSFTAMYEEILWEHGTGEEATPYEIWTRADLELLAIKVNAGKTFADSFFKLMADIDLADVSDGKDSAWVPIGWDDLNTYDDIDYLFSGTFDGNNHVISNVAVDTMRYAGLFGYVRDAAITNLGVENVAIYGAGHAGGLIGHCKDGTITNCYATGIIFAMAEEYAYAGGLIGNNRGTIANCYAIGTISAKTTGEGGISRVGGLIGHTSLGMITNCYAVGSVAASTNNETVLIGGLIGNASRSGARFTNCYAAAAITVTITGDAKSIAVGGLIGTNAATLSNCYATGAISAENIEKRRVGGLVGLNLGTGNVKNCYYDEITTGQSDDDGKGAPLPTREMTTPAFVATLNNFQNPKPWKGLPDSYPRLGWENVITPIIQSGSYIVTQNGGSQFPHDGFSEETAYSFAALLELSESGRLTADSYTFIFKAGEYKNFALNLPSVKTLYIIFEEGATAGTNGVAPMLELPNAQYVEITGLHVFGASMTADRPLIINAPDAELILSNAVIENNRFAHEPSLIKAKKVSVRHSRIHNNTNEMSIQR